ncbi:FAD-binding oxidoreductase [Methylonatrum kenyense]|uniref:FAD-binding oxidoreductase n=1 Tax=Methylonatrum kenyense TaxID=455253 RepID=UPI0020BE3A39|nr:FAD-binding oxidoreductase [Methylonatrum kenyense]MCK8516857.1 FAD-binding oxidoreductase [Methylonatrum kenyense]
MSDSREQDRRQALEALRSSLEPQVWIEGERQAPFLKEWRGRYQGRAAAVLCPGSTGEVALILRHCHDASITVVPQSGNTGLVGGGAPDTSGTQVILSLRRMNRIRDIDADNGTLTAEAGCVLADLQAAAQRIDRLFPLSLASEGSCQIGGNLATNAGGTNVLRYGNARDLTLGLEVVLADGRIWDGLRSLRKDNSGFDLRNLFIGSEGTLGVITAAVLKLFPRPATTITALLGVETPTQAVQLLGQLRQASGDALTGCELMSRASLEMSLHHVPGCRDPFDSAHAWYLLVEASSSGTGTALREALELALGEALEANAVSDAVFADSMAQAAALWRLRESIPEGQVRYGASIKHDISVPVSRIPEFLAQAQAALEALIPGLRICAFGHIGDGNLHFNLSQPADCGRDAFLARETECNRLVFDLVDALGGSIAAEHGVGQLRLDALDRYKSDVELDLMRSIKQALDPRGILNPGKVVKG